MLKLALKIASRHCRLVVAACLIAAGPFLVPGLAGAGGAGAEVSGVRLWAGPDSTRVVLDLSTPVEHTLFTLNDPPRVVVDLPNARLSQAELTPPTGVVSGIRHGVRNGTTLRIVLEVAEEVSPHSFVAAPNEVYGHRLVIDLSPQEAHIPLPVKRLNATDVPARDVIVAVVAGHGGEDPGAIGARGTREKTVVLEIARRVARAINAEKGMRAVLIRDGDYSVSLRRRMERAREHSADLFVAIHADAFRDPRAHGSSVYVLSERGASSEAARWLAERENAADLIGGVRLNDKDDVLASVLLDLSQTASLSASMRAAEYVSEELAKVGRVRRGGEVQQANFLVLKSPDIPSFLVETAFISNPDEEKRLTQAESQQRWADAIYAGIRSYFWQNPPPGSLLASERHERLPERYVIVAGDTLSGIADRYRVSINKLRSANRLRDDRLQVGQIIAIPIASGG